MGRRIIKVSPSPHIRDNVTTTKIMLFVIIALLPACVAGVLNFGPRALIMLVTTTAAAVITEYLYQKMMHKEILVGDLSAVVTGLILGMNMPATAPYWMGAMGSVFAIIIVKQLFGGIGQNFMNPALGARCFLVISFAGPMTTFTYDGITSATPLAVLKAGNSVNILDMFLGNTAGTIGETSTLALLAGAIFLLLTKVIDLRVPGSYILSFVIFAGIFGHVANPDVGFFEIPYLAAHLCGGGLMLGAWFMANDYSSSPITKRGQIYYGILLGILTGLFRIFGGSAEGVSYAIILGNLLVPLIEKMSVPKHFGEGANKNE